MSCPYCKGAWSISTGPGRVVGAAASSIFGVYVPLPDDFAFEYCPPCAIRNMTPELESRLLVVEKAHLNSPTKGLEPLRPDNLEPVGDVRLAARELVESWEDRGFAFTGPAGRDAMIGMIAAKLWGLRPTTAVDLAMSSDGASPPDSGEVT